jgi:hypothetical protein
VLDGDPAPEQTSVVFQQVVVREAIWQNALEECYARGLLSQHAVYSPEWWDWKHITWMSHAISKGWICERWPQMVLDIISGSGPVSCNFHVDGFSRWDVEQVISNNRSWSHKDWQQSWSGRPPRNSVFPTLPPLPSLVVLAEEVLLPRAAA